PRETRISPRNCSGSPPGRSTGSSTGSRRRAEPPGRPSAGRTTICQNRRARHCQLVVGWPATSLLRPRQGHTLVAWALLVRTAYGDLAPAISVGPDCPRGADRRVSLRTHREHAHSRGNRAEARAAAAVHRSDAGDDAGL